MREIWCDHENRQTFEHELINRKTTWLLTTQGLLFAAYGVTFGRVAEGTDPLDRFRVVVAWAGLLVALVLFVGVAGLIESKHASWVAYRDYFNDQGRTSYLPGPLADKELPWGVETHNTRLTLAPDLALPIGFAVAWAAILVWAD